MSVLKGDCAGHCGTQSRDLTSDSGRCAYVCGVKTFELNPEQMWGFVQWRRQGRTSVGSGNSSDTGMGLHALLDGAGPGCGRRGG